MFFMSFEEEIFSLIKLKDKGTYWNFKKEWYENNFNLLHDIICMANNLDDRDAYIIIGVEDNTFSVIEVDKNRKHTHELTDFLVGVKFAGDNRPSVEVKTITYDSKFIDVIVIKESNLVPYYLSKDYPSNKIKEKKSFLRCGNIYTRKKDRNTAINCTAYPDEIEKLWKSRFFLDKTPLKRVEELLKDTKEWIDDPLDENIPNLIKFKYHEYFPEFSINVFKDDSLFSSEWYLSEQGCANPCVVQICFQDTVLSKYNGAFEIDEPCNLFCVVAPHKFINTFNVKNSNILFFYYVFQNELQYSISSILSSNFYSKCLPIIEFFNEDEFQQFIIKFQLNRPLEFSLISNLFKSESQNKSYDHCFPNDSDQSYLRSLLIFSRCIEKKLNEFRQIKHTDIITK